MNCLQILSVVRTSGTTGIDECTPAGGTTSPQHGSSQRAYVDIHASKPHPPSWIHASTLCANERAGVMVHGTGKRVVVL